MPDPRKKLYTALSGQFNLGTEQEFNSKMDNPESRKKLYNAVSSKFDLGSYDEFESKVAPVKKKDQSISSSKETKLASETQPGSSVGLVDNPLKPKTISKKTNTPSQNNFDEGTMTWNLQKLKEANKTIDLDWQKAKQAKQVAPEKIAELQKEVDDEATTTGIWNTTKSIAKKGWNALVDWVSEASDEGGVKELKTNTDPLFEQKKQAEKEFAKQRLEARKAKKPIPIFTKEDVLNKAKEIRLDEKIKSQSNSQITSFLRDLENTKSSDSSNTSAREDLDFYNKLKLSSLGEEQKNNIIQQDILRNKLTGKVNELKHYQELFTEYKKQNKPIPNDLLNDYKQNYADYQSTLKDGLKLDDDFVENKNDLGNAQENIDLFKRNYSWTKNFMNNMEASTSDLLSGVAGSYDYFLGLKQNVIGDSGIDKTIQLKARELSGKLQGASQSAREEVAKPLNVDDINTPQDFGAWLSNSVVANQVPYYLAIATGYGGVAAIGASSTGNKYEEMLSEMQNGKNYSDTELALKPLAYGATETASSLVDLMLLKNANRVIKSATVAEKEMIAKGFWENAKNISKETLKSGVVEGLDESGTQIAQNLIDGKPLLEGIKDAGLAGAVMGALLPLGAHTIKSGIKPFSKDNKLNKQSKVLEDLKNQLNNPELNDSEKSIIQEQILKSEKAINDNITSTVKDIQNMPNEKFQEVLNIENDKKVLKDKAIEINSSAISEEARKSIISDLKNEYDGIEQKRVDILNSDFKTKEGIEETTKEEVMPDELQNNNLKVSEDKYSINIDVIGNNDNVVSELTIEKEENGEYRVNSIKTKEDFKRKGFAYSAYLKMIDLANERGIIINSDKSSLSFEAEKLWDKLVENGLAVKTGEVKNQSKDYSDRANFNTYSTILKNEETPTNNIIPYSEQNNKTKLESNNNQIKKGLYTQEEIDLNNDFYDKEFDEISYEIEKKLKEKGEYSFERLSDEQRKDKRILENIKNRNKLYDHNNEIIKSVISNAIDNINLKGRFRSINIENFVTEKLKKTLSKRFLLDYDLNIYEKLKNSFEGKELEGLRQDFVNVFLPDGTRFNELSSDEQTEALEKTKDLFEKFTSDVSKGIIQNTNETETTNDIIPDGEIQSGINELDSRGFNQQENSKTEAIQSSNDIGNIEEEKVTIPETKSFYETVLNKDNIKSALDFLDSLKLDTNDLKSTLPFAPQTWNAMVEAVKTSLKVGNTMLQAITEAKKLLKSQGFNDDEINNVANSFSEKAGVKLKENEGNFIRKQGRNSVLERAKKGGNSEKITNILNEIDSNYEVSNQDKSYKKVVDLVNEIGIGEAYNLIKENKVNGDVKSFLYNEILQRMTKEIDVALENTNTIEDYSKAQEELLDEYQKIAKEFADFQTKSGQASSAMNYIYNLNSDLRYELSKQINDYKATNHGEISPEILQKFQQADKTIKDLNNRIKELEKAKEEAEMQQAVDVISESLKKGKNTQRKSSYYSKEKRQKIANKLRDYKFVSDGNTMMVTVPGLKAAYNAAIEITATAIESDVTGNIAEAIEKGIDSLKKSEFYKKLNKQEQEKYTADLQDQLEDILKPEAEIDENGNIKIPTELIKFYISKGITDANELANTILNDLKVQDDTLTLRQVRDAITGYGKEVRKTKTDLDNEVTKLKSLGRLYSKLEDLQNGIVKAKAPKVKSQLTEKQKQLKSQIKTLENELGITASNRLETAKKRTQDRIKELDERIKNKDFAKKELPPLKEDAELRKLRTEKVLQQEIFDKEKYLAEIANRTIWQKIKDSCFGLGNTLRAIKATGEFSYILIQGGTQTISNPKRAFRAFKNMLLSMFKSGHLNNIEAELKASEYYDIIKKSKLGITEADHKLEAREEMFLGDYLNSVIDLVLSTTEIISKTEKAKKQSQILKEYNPLRILERGATSYLNQMRVERFLDGMKKLEAEGKNINDNLDDYKALASAINTLTGRANLPISLQQNSKLLSVVFFSPRNWVSKVNMMNPYFYYSLRNKDGGVSVAQKIMFTDMAKFITTTVGMMYLMQIAFGKDEDDEWVVQIEKDPKSSDFMKMRFGNLRLDPWGGLQSTVTFVSRMLSGETKSTKTGKVTSLGDGFGSKTRWDLGIDYVSGKFSPAMSIAAEFAKSKEALITEDKEGNKLEKPYMGRIDKFGNEFDPLNSENLMPIYWAGWNEIKKEQPGLAGDLALALGFLGYNTQVYGSKKK